MENATPASNMAEFTWEETVFFLIKKLKRERNKKSRAIRCEVLPSPTSFQNHLWAEIKHRKSEHKKNMFEEVLGNWKKQFILHSLL